MSSTPINAEATPRKKAKGAAAIIAGRAL